MAIWIDAQLSPDIAEFLQSELGMNAIPLRALGLRDAKDEQIFIEAREANAVVMTKDQDFCNLLERFGSPPCILWITCGNTSNEYLCGLLRSAMPAAMQMFDAGESLVEIF
jgi:predicted nuclease of predicted toxin-antitoxin system